MDVISWQPYWLLKNGLLATYPTLQKNLHCQAVVVGGGITGALVSRTLVEAGIDTVLLERDDVGAGSTSGSTCLLQYELDKSLCDLTKTFGRKKAERIYLASYRAIDELELICKSIGLRENFQRKKSIYVASKKDDVEKIKAETKARKEAGIEVAFISQKKLLKKYHCRGYGAICSAQAAQLDPYLFTNTLLTQLVRKGLRIFDRSNVKSFDTAPQGVTVYCNGFNVKARHLIIASGYEANKWIPKNLVKLHSTFAMTSKPNPKDAKKFNNSLFWDTAQPYFYARTTTDHRFIVGGLDEEFQNAEKRDHLIPKKKQKLLLEFRKRFPSIEPEVAYAWAGTFGETHDGLPYIGKLARYLNTYFACGYGGNGITFSVSAANIIAKTILGRKHKDADLFSFSRLDI